MIRYSYRIRGFLVVDRVMMKKTKRNRGSANWRGALRIAMVRSLLVQRIGLAHLHAVIAKMAALVRSL
jgi:hypothetical protein